MRPPFLRPQSAFLHSAFNCATQRRRRPCQALERRRASRHGRCRRHRVFPRTGQLAPMGVTEKFPKGGGEWGTRARYGCDPSIPRRHGSTARFACGRFAPSKSCPLRAARLGHCFVRRLENPRATCICDCGPEDPCFGKLFTDNKNLCRFGGLPLRQNRP